MHQSKFLLDAHWLWRRVYWNSLTSLCIDVCGLCASGSGIGSFCVPLVSFLLCSSLLRPIDVFGLLRSIATVFDLLRSIATVFDVLRSIATVFDLLRSILFCHLLRSIITHSHYVYFSCRNPWIPAPVTLMDHS